MKENLPPARKLTQDLSDIESLRDLHLKWSDVVCDIFCPTPCLPGFDIFGSMASPRGTYRPQIITLELIKNTARSSVYRASAVYEKGESGSENFDSFIDYEIFIYTRDPDIEGNILWDSVHHIQALKLDIAPGETVEDFSFEKIEKFYPKYIADGDCGCNTE